MAGREGFYLLQAIGAGQPECKPGPLPVNCTGRLRGAQSVWCASFCVERDEFLRVPGKGGWHDPDMLLAGEPPCSAEATRAGMKCNVLPIEEQKTQLAIWAMANAPLQLSADLTFRQGNWLWDWPWPILTGTHLVTRSTGHERRDGVCGPCAPLSPDTGYATPLDFGRGAR